MVEISGIEPLLFVWGAVQTKTDSLSTVRFLVEISGIEPLTS